MNKKFLSLMLLNADNADINAYPAERKNIADNADNADKNAYPAERKNIAEC